MSNKVTYHESHWDHTESSGYNIFEDMERTLLRLKIITESRVKYETLQRFDMDYSRGYYGTEIASTRGDITSERPS